MALCRELSASAQTAYAELYELVQVAEAARSPAFLTGKVGWKTIKGKRYAYWQFKEYDGRKREYYLGPEGPGIVAIEAARDKPVPALESVARQAAAAVAQGNVATSAKHFHIVKRFADYQFFRAGGLLIGTHAFLALGNQLGGGMGQRHAHARSGFCACRPRRQCGGGLACRSGSQPGRCACLA